MPEAMRLLAPPLIGLKRPLHRGCSLSGR
jgi:hypothetical protein